VEKVSDIFTSAENKSSVDSYGNSIVVFYFDGGPDSGTSPKYLFTLGYSNDNTNSRISPSVKYPALYDTFIMRPIPRAVIT